MEGRISAYALDCNDFEKIENADLEEADNFKSNTHISVAIQPTFSLVVKSLVKTFKNIFFFITEG